MPAYARWLAEACGRTGQTLPALDHSPGRFTAVPSFADAITVLLSALR